jgi:hypothetical protein
MMLPGKTIAKNICMAVFAVLAIVFRGGAALAEEADGSCTITALVPEIPL